MVDILISRIKVSGWRQFEHVDIDIHPRLTVITGANGAGKSTILSIFARHFGWARPLLNVPQQDDLGKLSYDTAKFESSQPKDDADRNDEKLFAGRQIGRVYYNTTMTAQIVLDDSKTAQSNLNINGQNPVAGLFIDSHRPFPNYQVVGNISLQAVTPEQAYSLYNQEMFTRFLGQTHNSSTPIYRMKEAIISMAIFGEGNKQVGYDKALLDIYQGFSKILRSILPESLGFERLAVRKPEVVLITKSGEFMLDAASGGIAALIDIAWRIYMFSIGKKVFSVAIDEPENHLHPTIQRSLMRRLLTAFPNAQFIIATHSPFMVTSVKDSNVYVLRYEEIPFSKHDISEVKEFLGLRVVSEKLDSLSKSSNTSDIFREVLGVSATMPEWVEEGIEQIVTKYKKLDFTRDMLNRLRLDLVELGYSDYYPEVISQITNRQ